MELFGRTLPTATSFGRMARLRVTNQMAHSSIHLPVQAVTVTVAVVTVVVVVTVAVTVTVVA
jgi:hypothetical protein